MLEWFLGPTAALFDLNRDGKLSATEEAFALHTIERMASSSNDGNAFDTDDTYDPFNDGMLDDDFGRDLLKDDY